MNFEMTVRAVEPVTVAAMRYQGPIAGAAKQFPIVFRAIRGRANGAPFFHYYRMDPESHTAELELCVPTAATPDRQGVFIQDLPGAQALCLTHIGPYAELPLAYAAMHRAIRERGLPVQGPWREVFIKGPGLFLKGDPKQYITEIIFPLKEA
ncbi:GyrI-like small molecule binding protein [Hydrogenispora ethanolica]|uniref:GyrI-like small molecule binding protein n=1 Tax=Hydrogenispora ethanolica TaxID=1082276 RepID=A0A4V2QDU1_HYDET|nr:GyrI-like domain-containing protein [Hydrogenispora ethanolica]TCL65277.1 GyrI-like small molecule binding protein [Hydrogenispora ethanolica]